MRSREQALHGVLLDIDGTLLDSNAAHARAWADTLRRHGHDATEHTVRPLIGKGGDKLLAELLGIDDASPEGKLLSDERRQRFLREHLPRLRPTNGARALLDRLRADGLQLVVATSASGDELQALLRQAGAGDLAACAATSSDADGSKPDPDIVLAALAKAGLSADRAVMVGDTPYDVAAAAKAGVPTIALRCGGWWDDAALAGAAALYDDPADLLARIDASPLR